MAIESPVPTRATSDTISPVDSAPSTRGPSPAGFHHSRVIVPESRSISPVSTPDSSRPPSPLLRAFNQLSMNPLTQTSAAAMAPVEAELEPISLSRANSLSKKPRRMSSPAMAPFLTAFEPMDGTGKTQRVAVIGSGSWGTALARLAAVNVVEKEGFAKVSLACDPEKKIRKKKKISVKTFGFGTGWLTFSELPGQ